MNFDFKIYKRDNTKEDWYDPLCSNEFTEYTYMMVYFNLMLL